MEQLRSRSFRIKKGGEFMHGISWEVFELSLKLLVSLMETWLKLSCISSHAAMMMVYRALVSDWTLILITRRKIVD